jgi:hypothetical protein
MTRHERSWCLSYAVLLVVLTTLPYFLGFAIQEDVWRFTGFVFGVEDGNSYIAKMLLGAQGAWIFRTPYTNIHQQGVIAFLPYLLLGKLAAGVGIHVQLVVLFHLFRILATPLAVLATYQFVALFIKSASWRRWVTVLATVGGGLGWVLTVMGNSFWLGSLPLDIHSPETFGFLAFYGLPHLVLARALLLLGLTYYLQSEKKPLSGWVAGLCFLILALVQPLSVVSAYAVITAHQALIFLSTLRRRRWQDWRPWLSAAVRAASVPLPFMAYMFFVFNRDPFLKSWTAQNRILSPHPAHYLVAFGLVILPSIAGYVRMAQDGRKRGLLLIAWALSLPLLAYVPYNLQRRLPEGVWVAFATLAAVGLSGWIDIKADKRRWIKWAILILSLPTSLLLLTGGINVAIHPSEPAFRPIEEVEAASWLIGEGETGSIVLASYISGNVLPALAPVRVIVGHGPESSNLEALLPLVSAFYGDEMMDQERISFIDDMDIEYVWYGPHERELGSWDPKDAGFLSVIYKKGNYEIYQTITSP